MNKSLHFLEQVKRIPDLLRENRSEIVYKRATKAFLDYIAVTVAGAAFQREKLERYFSFSLPEPGDFTVIGMYRKLALKEAVFLNGLNSHALDYDDGTNAGIIHLGSPIFSLLIPLAERYDMELEKLLTAVIIGYEASYTMAISINPQNKALGYHATGTCGVLGATLAASYALDFTEEERFNAFSAACLSASGMLKVLDEGSELKPYNVAKTALLSLTSLQLAKSGFKGPVDPLGGHRGFLKMMTGDENAEIKNILCDGAFAITKAYIKPYASCRFTHPAVEAACKLRRRVGENEVERIDIKTYSLAVAGHDYANVSNAYSAKMSIPYAVAVGFIFGKAGLKEFDDACIRDRRVLSFAEKIHVEADETLNKKFPAVQTAVVGVTKIDGTVLCENVDFPKGEPENPLTDDEFRKRYNDLMTYAAFNLSHGEKIFNLVSKPGG